MEALYFVSFILRPLRSLTKLSNEALAKIKYSAVLNLLCHLKYYLSSAQVLNTQPVLLQGFYKRSTTRAEKYKCFFGGSCKLSPQNRNRCKACRYQICLDAGMSLDGK